jgi:hypothetical protein
MSQKAEKKRCPACITIRKTIGGYQHNMKIQCMKKEGHVTPDSILDSVHLFDCIIGWDDMSFFIKAQLFYDKNCEDDPDEPTS